MKEQLLVVGERNVYHRWVLAGLSQPAPNQNADLKSVLGSEMR